MTAIELKKHLMHKIAEINDLTFLNTIKTILDTQTQRRTLSLTSVQMQEIAESKNEIQQGLFF
jgi:hypothetical protein